MTETALRYWRFLRRYRKAPPNEQRTILSGQALLMMRDTKSPSVKRRLRTFVVQECERHRLPDRTAMFQ
jgi:hypothetical protein